MKMTYKQVLEAALALKKRDQKKLVDHIDITLHPRIKDIDEMDQKELHAELERRHQEYLRDPSVGIPLEKVLAKLDREFANAGHSPSPRRKRVRQRV